MTSKILKTNKYVYTENNSILFDDSSSKDIEDVSTDIFNRFTIGVSKDVITTLLNKYIYVAKRYGSIDFHKYIVDIFKLAFMVRDCRGNEGRGFRDIFYHIIDHLHDQFPHIVYSLINHIPIYGSWKDIFNLIIKYSYQPHKKYFMNRLIDVVECQRNYDLANIGNISLLAKYIPSEKSKNKRVAKILANHFYTKQEIHINNIWKRYRKDNAKLNKKLDTVEIKMCNDSYDEIKYETVPGKALKNYTSAFANEKKMRGSIKQRYPDNESRVRGAINYKSFLNNTTISKKGTKLYPHEILKPFITHRNNKVISETDIQLIEQQFNDWVLKMCDIMRENESFLKMIIMCDVSGSMYGTPIEVSISLSYLFATAIAIVEKEKYGKVIWGNRMMVFSNEPYWFMIAPELSLQNNIKDLCETPWHGTNTDFLAVHEMILDVAITNKISSDKMPLMMLTTSDMQFDSANRDN